MAASKIEWTGRSDWNPVRGCSRKSEGCRNCYAEIMAARFSDPGQWGHGFAHIVDMGQGRDHRWTGKVELVRDRLLLPLGWKKPTMVFPSSTSDIFHESLTDDEIDQIFAVMALCPHLTFQPLTKRSARMRKYMSDPATPRRIARAVLDMAIADPRLLNRQSWPVISEGDIDDPSDVSVAWPLRNVWLGVSVEDQTRADERIPDLLATPAVVRWISAEPLLGPVDLGAITSDGWVIKALKGEIYRPYGATWGAYPKIDWVVVGGESGPDARGSIAEVETNMRSLRDQCADACTPFFGKQGFKKHPLPHDLMVREFPRGVQHDGYPA